MAEARVTIESYALLAAASAGYFLFTFSWFALAAALVPVMDQLGLSGTEAGIVTGAVQLSYIPLALLSGLAIDRLGSRRSIGAGLLVIGLAHTLRGVATDFLTLLLPTLLLGVGGTAITFGLPKLVSELFPAERSGSMSSVYAIGATLGTATVFALARPVILPLVGGWGPFFRYTGVVVIGFGLLWIGLSGVLWRRADHFGADDADQGFTIASMRSDLGRVLTHYGLLLLVVVGTMRLFISHGLSGWLATILEARGLTPALAGTLTSAFILVRILGIVTVPALSDRFATRRLPIIVCGLAGTVGLVGLLLGTSLLVIAPSLALIGAFVIGGLSPLVRAIPIELDGIGPGLTAVANGLIFTVGEVGGFLGPVSIGVIEETTGTFEPAIVLLAVASFVTAVAGYAMDEPGGSGGGSSAGE